MGVFPEASSGGFEYFGEVLRQAIERKAASFHLTVGLPPTLRVNKELEPIEGLASATRDQLMELISWLLDDEQRRAMNKQGEVTRSYAPSFAPAEVFDLTFLWSAGEPAVVGNYYTAKFAEGRLRETAPISEEEILDSIAAQMGMKRIDLDDIEITSDLLHQIPKDFVLKRRVFPIGHNESELKIAVHDPTDILVRDNLEKMLKIKVVAYLTSEEQIDSYIHRYY